MDSQETIPADRPPRPSHGPVQLDFRSAHFAHGAFALQRLTGRSLLLCRQELFIAEGNVVEAWHVLVGGPAADSPRVVMH